MHASGMGRVLPAGQEMDGGYHAMNMLLSRVPAERPTALICFNDAIAVGVEHAIQTAGMHVPEDFSIVSFDDTAIAAHASPPLTTITQPKYRMGMMAVQMLRKMLQNPDEPGDSILSESPLIVRKSTGPASNDPRTAVIADF